MKSLPDKGLPMDARPAASKPASWLYDCTMILLIVAAVVLRALRIDDPMRYDEAFNVIFFAASNDPSHLFNYLAPNNHVLHTLLVRASIFFLVGVSPLIVRMPAFLAGIAIVPAAAHFARVLSGSRWAAIAAAALVSASSILIEYSTNARGYSLVCLLTLLLLTSSLAIARGLGSFRDWSKFVLCGAAGLFTIPIMFYPIATAVVAILLQWTLTRPGWAEFRRRAGRLVLALLATAAMTLLAYTPVFMVSGLRSVFANEFVVPGKLQTVLVGLWPVVSQAILDWTRDTSWLWQGLLIVGLCVSLVVALRRREPFWMWPILAMFIVVGGALAHRVLPFPRVWLFILPAALAVSACGLVQLARVLPRWGARAAGAILAVFLVAAAGNAAWQCEHRPYLISEDARTLVDAREIAVDLKPQLDGKTVIVSQPPSWQPLWYYLIMGGSVPPLDYRLPEIERVFVVVGDRQDLTGVLAANKGFGTLYSCPEEWKSYPHAKVYLTHRLPH